MRIVILRKRNHFPDANSLDAFQTSKHFTLIPFHVFYNCGSVVIRLNLYFFINFLLLPPQGFRPEAKSRGGTLVTRAYIKDSTHSSNIQ